MSNGLKLIDNGTMMLCGDKMEEKFVPTQELLLPDNDEVKKIKTIYKKEGTYAWLLGRIEFSIASYYLDNPETTDEDVVKALQNFRSNYDKGMNQDSMEGYIQHAASVALQEKAVTKHEFLLVIDYILWSIDNRSWVPDERAYLNWICHFLGLMDKEKEKTFNFFYDLLGNVLDLKQFEVETMKFNKNTNLEQRKRVYVFKVMFSRRRGFWRVIEIRGNQTLETFSDEIVRAFKHEPFHLMEFKIGGRTFGPLESGSDFDYDYKDVDVASLQLELGDRFTYIYDFGDDIQHTIELVEIKSPEDNVKYPRVTEKSRPRYKYCSCCKDDQKKVANWIDLGKGKVKFLCEQCAEKYPEGMLEEIVY